MSAHSIWEWSLLYEALDTASAVRHIVLLSMSTSIDPILLSPNLSLVLLPS